MYFNVKKKDLGGRSRQTEMYKREFSKFWSSTVDLNKSVGVCLFAVYA